MQEAKLNPQLSVRLESAEAAAASLNEQNISLKQELAYVRNAVAEHEVRQMISGKFELSRCVRVRQP